MDYQEAGSLGVSDRCAVHIRPYSDWGVEAHEVTQWVEEQVHWEDRASAGIGRAW